MKTRITIGSVTIEIEEENDDEDEGANDLPAVAIAKVETVPDEPEAATSIGHYHHMLSGREQRILELLAAGLSNKEIARKLVVTESTVKVHMKTILRKTQCRNRTEAAIMHTNGRIHIGGDKL